MALIVCLPLRRDHLSCGREPLTVHSQNNLGLPPKYGPTRAHLPTGITLLLPVISARWGKQSTAMDLGNISPGVDAWGI